MHWIELTTVRQKIAVIRSVSLIKLCYNLLLIVYLVQINVLFSFRVG
jgi:hypothetical protein